MIHSKSNTNVLLEKTIFFKVKLQEQLVNLQLEDFTPVSHKLEALNTVLQELESSLGRLAVNDKIVMNISQKLFENVKYSFFNVVHLTKEKSNRCAMKLEFELIPLTQILYIAVYYCCSIRGNEAKERYFQEVEYPDLIKNTYVVASEKNHSYKYDLTIAMPAFNKLEYTKKCVESILDVVDPSLNYELILCNHGSSDGTKEYFESIGCTKQIDLKENDLTFSILMNHLICEGKYYCNISNDIILCKNSIQNMLTCITSDDSIKYVVPITTNMLNNQEPKLPSDCMTIEEIVAWGDSNNVSDPFQWEHRVQLYNPVTAVHSNDFLGEKAVFRTPLSLRLSGADGNDCVMSVLTRRAGGKCILAKDAFCYHHGSVTRRDDSNLKNPAYWKQKVSAIEKVTHVSHEATGRCYSNTLMAQIDFSDKTGHKEILGLNCGLGSNPLKCKELHKELNHNLDCCVTNIQDTVEFALDLPSLCDEVRFIEDFSALTEAVSRKKYDCIIWEDPFLIAIEEATFFQTLKDSLREGGTLLIGQPTEKAKLFFQDHTIVEYINHKTGIACLVYHKK